MEHYLTVEGKKQLEEELNFYRTVKRPEVIQRIATARELGDLSENEEYSTAKNDQSIIEGKIAEMEDILMNAKIIDKSELSCEKVAVGSKVKLYDQMFDEEVEYTITGSTETNPRLGLISNLSPVGKALIGHKKGDEVRVMTEAGIVVYKILNISV